MLACVRPGARASTICSPGSTTSASPHSPRAERDAPRIATTPGTRASAGTMRRKSCASTAKRGRPGTRALPASNIPASTLAETSTYETTPPARAAYQTVVEATDAYRRLRALRPAAGEDDLGLGHEPALQALALEPRSRRRPRRNADLAATSAARHVPAQTVTACQRTSAGRPDRSGGGHGRLLREATTSSSRRSSRARPNRGSRCPAGSATTSEPRVARSPPAETKPSPSSSASASSTARRPTTPLRSRRRPTGRWTSRPEPDLAPAACGNRLPERAGLRSRRRSGRSPRIGARRRSSGHRGRRSPAPRAASSSAVAWSGDTITVPAGERLSARGRRSAESG